MAVSVAEWASGDDGDSDSPLAWDMHPAHLLAPPGSAMFLSWYQYHSKNILPRAGGYLDQDLSWLVQANVFSLLYQTFHNRHAEGFRMDKLNKLQLALLTWIEKDEPDGR